MYQLLLMTPYRFVRLWVIICVVGLGLCIWPYSWSHADSLRVSYQPCAKTIEVSAKDVAIQDLLIRLSEELGFTLSLSPKVDYRVSYQGIFHPEAFLNRLLKNKNHVVSTGKSKLCPGIRQITAITLLAPGELSSSSDIVEYIPPPKIRRQDTRWEYLEIDDMEHYVDDVNNKAHKANKAKMTPEQKAEFMRVKKIRKKSDSYDRHED